MVLSAVLIVIRLKMMVPTYQSPKKVSFAAKKTQTENKKKYANTQISHETFTRDFSLQKHSKNKNLITGIALAKCLFSRLYETGYFPDECTNKGTEFGVRTIKVLG